MGLQLYVILSVILAVMFSQAWSLSRSSEDWDHFTLTQSWPPGTCAEGVHEGHTCNVGPNIQTWTIHGLWPGFSTKEGPENCNSSWKFDFSQVARLSQQLDTFWPNLYNDTPKDSFWEHEWEKHGTCSTNLNATRDEYNYFSTGLNLRQKYNLDSILAKANIVPKVGLEYSVKDILNAVKTFTGYSPRLQCAQKNNDYGEEVTMIFQIEICIDKAFEPISCSSQGHSNGLASGNSTLYYKRSTYCPKTFQYPPIQHN